MEAVQVHASQLSPAAQKMAEMEADMAAKRNRRKQRPRKKPDVPRHLQTSEEDEEERDRNIDDRSRRKKKKKKSDTADKEKTATNPADKTLPQTGSDQFDTAPSRKTKPRARNCELVLTAQQISEQERANEGDEEKKKEEEEKKEDEHFQKLHAEISDGKKRVSWKGSSELTTTREIDPYDSGSTATSHSTSHDAATSVTAQDLGEYCWHPEQHGSNMLVLADQRSIIRRLPAKQQTDGARALYGFSHGRHVFHFAFNDKPWGSHCGVGLCTDEAGMSISGYDVLFGRDVCSWAWDLPSGRLIHDREVVAWCPEDPADLPRTIQMCVDFDKDHVVFLINGEEMAGFTGIKESNTKLYPCVSLVYGLSEVKITLLESSLPFPSLTREAKEEKKDDSKEEEEEVVHSLAMDEEMDEDMNSVKQEEEEVESLPLADDRTKHMDEQGKEEDEEVKSLPMDADSKQGRHKRKKQKSKRKEKEDKSKRPEEEKEHEESVTQKESKESEKPSQDEEGDIAKDIEKKNNSQIDGESRDQNERANEKRKAKKSDKSSESETETEIESHAQETETQLHQDDENHGDGSMSNESEVDLFKELKANESKARESESETDMKPKTPDPFEMVKHQKMKPPLVSRDSYMVGLQQQAGPSTEQDGGVPPAPAYDAPKKKVKASELDTIPAASYESPPNSELSKQETFISFLEDESEEEEEEEEYLDVEDLDEDDQYVLQLTHGWDPINRGGQLQPYPNVPYICVPMPTFGEKVQMVRSRQGFTRGVHTVRFIERRFYSPIAKGRKASGNKLLLGVVSESHRTFNYGFGLPHIGPYAWLWDPVSKMVWHGNDKEAYFPDEYDASKQTQHGVIQFADEHKKNVVDMTKGIEMTLNKKGRHLIFTYEGEQVAEIQNIRAKKLFPVAVFNGRAVFPLEIRYLEGPASHITDTLRCARTMPQYERADFQNYRPLIRQLSSKYSMDKLDNPAIDTGYNFGAYSSGIQLSGTLTAKNVLRQVEAPSNPLARNMAMAAKSLSGIGSRHKIDFISTAQHHYMYGLVSRDFDKLALDKSGAKRYEEFPLLGSNSQSWVWDPLRHEIRHAGIIVGRFPSSHKGFDIRRYDRVRMTVDFSTTGYHTCSFEALTDVPGRATGASVDLGLAFVALPEEVWPVVGVASRETDRKGGGDGGGAGGRGRTELRMQYNSGPENMLTDMRRSAMCTLL